MPGFAVSHSYGLILLYIPVESLRVIRGAYQISIVSAHDSTSRVVVQFPKIPHFVRDDKSRKRHSERSEESFLIPKAIYDSK